MRDKTLNSLLSNQLNQSRGSNSQKSFYSVDKLELLVEASYYQISYPVVNHIVSSFIEKFCHKNNLTLPIKFDAASFNMNVQSLERTFIDKVFAVCDYKIQNMMDRDSRHLYDIAKILPNINLDDNLKEIVQADRLDRSKSKNNPSANSKYNINEMLKDIIDTRFYELDYKNITLKLLYDKISYDDAIKNGIEIILSTDVFN